jgi:hypothetical protein
MRWWSDGGAVWAAPRPCVVRERAGKVGEATSAKEGGGGTTIRHVSAPLVGSCVTRRVLGRSLKKTTSRGSNAKQPFVIV